MQTFLIILGIYFLLINLTTFIVRGIDKRKARKQQRRIKEKTLLELVAAGGRIGALLAMEYFRHKTIKGKFLIWFWLCVAGWVILGFLLLFLVG